MGKKGKNSILLCGSAGNEKWYLSATVLRELKTLCAYDSAYDLLETETLFLNDMDRDFIYFLRHVDEWESFQYFCVNGEFVIVADSISGDIISHHSLYQFFCDTKDYYAEQKEGENE